MKVVVFIDVQNDFVDGALPVDKDHETTKKIGKYAYVCKCEHIPLIATRDTHSDADHDFTEFDDTLYYDETLEGKNLAIPHCIYKTHGWELADELKDYVPETNIVDKTTFGSIEDLVARIHIINDSFEETFDEKIDEIEICGYCGSICVVSNALILRAAFPNTKITLLKNLCADVDEESFNATLKVLHNCMIDVRDAIV